MIREALDTGQVKKDHLHMQRVLRRSFRTVTREYRRVSLQCVAGELPADIRGVLNRNGPGRLERGGHSYGHPFDGDGMICRYEFRDDSVLYSNRYVRTREFAAEEERNELLFRGFGTNLPGGLKRNLLRFRFKNAANTNVIAHDGQLFALWEGGWPHLLNGETLDTLGRHHFDYALRNTLPASDRFPVVLKPLAARIEQTLMPELPFSAHPALDPETGELFNFGMAYGIDNRLLIYRADPDGKLDEPRVIVLDELAFVHDFVLTKNWLVFFLPDVTFDVARALVGLTSPVGALRLHSDKPMRILLVPRDGGEPTMMTGPSGFVFHFANGFERPDDRIEVTGMRMQEFPDFGDYAGLFSEKGVPDAIPHPMRFILDPEQRTAEWETLSDVGAELPRVRPERSGREYRYTWFIAVPAGSPWPYLSMVSRLDVRSGQTLSRDFYPNLPGEPVVVSREGDAGVWLLVPIYVAREHSNQLLILDGDSLETAARFQLPHHIPPGFHGSWVPEGNSGWAV